MEKNTQTKPALYATCIGREMVLLQDRKHLSQNDNEITVQPSIKLWEVIYMKINKLQEIHLEENAKQLTLYTI